MNWVDLVILIIVFFFAANGLKRGFAIQVFDILGFLLSLIFSLTFYPQAAKLLTSNFNLAPMVANPVGFLFLWLTFETIFFSIASRFAGAFIFSFSAKPLNKFLGFVPATANALLFLAFLLLFTVSLPIAPQIKKDIFASKAGPPLVQAASVLEKPLNSVFGPIAKQTLTFLTISPEEKGSIPLQFTQKEQTIDFASEQRMFELVNLERQKEGTKPLVWDESLAQVGRAHSKDMFARGYFSHFSPEGQDVGDRLDQSGITYLVAGENLALAPNVNRAHDGLINSPGHRRNILDPAFSKIGIGAVDGGVWGKIFTQVFTN